MSLMITQLSPLLRLLLLLLHVEYSLAYRDIPNDIREIIREASTIDELRNVTQLTYARHLLENEDEPTFNNYKVLQPEKLRYHRNRMRTMRLYKAVALSSNIEMQPHFSGSLIFPYFIPFFIEI